MEIVSPSSADPTLRPGTPELPPSASTALVAEATEPSSRFTGPEPDAQSGSGPIPLRPLRASVEIIPLSHDERVQLLIGYAEALNTHVQAELRALALCLTRDEFCTACCRLLKELAPLNQFLLSAQVAIRYGQLPPDGPPSGATPERGQPSKLITNRKPKPQ